MEYWAHQSAFIDNGAIIGKDTKVWHFCHICAGAKIGDNCTIGHSVFVAPGAVIGNGCKIQNHVSIYDGVTLDDYVFVGPSVCFTNVKNPRAFLNKKNKFVKTYVMVGATIGAHATIICGNSIGRYAFIAAGSVVTKNVGHFEVVAGIPAEVINTTDDKASNL